MIKLTLTIKDNRKSTNISLKGFGLAPTKNEDKFVNYLKKSIDTYKKCEEMTFDEVLHSFEKWRTKNVFRT